MPSNQDTKNDPHDVLEIAPDVVLVARAAGEFPSLAPDSVSQPFSRQPNMGNMGAAPDLTAAPRVDATFRASDVNDIPGLRSGARWLRRGAMAFLFAFLSVIATAAWQRYGDEAQAMAADLTSRVDLAAWLPWQKSQAATPADTSSSAAPASVATATDQAAAPVAAQPADSTAAPAAAAAASPQSPPSQDPAQTLQSVTRDVASLTQQLEALKASIAELKASQEQLSQQMSRDMAKPRAAEAKLPETRPAEHKPAKLGAPPRPLGTIVQRNPRPPTYPPMQAAAAPLPPPGAGSPLPVQISPGPPPAAASDASDDGVIVRPPMPVR
jgi:hypothetical protein